MSGNPRILIVEDDVGKRYTVVRQLRSAGFEIWEAATGAAALTLVHELPDLVILDIGLPDCDGLELCRQLKQDPHTNAVLVLALSARYTTSSDRSRGLDTGADGYLTHPVDGDELIATVRALLRLRESERDRTRLLGEVEASERRYRTIADTATVGLCLIDVDARCTLLNRAAAQLLGVSAESVRGRPAQELLAPRTADGQRIVVTEPPIVAIATGGPGIQGVRRLIAGAGGELIQVELSANPIVVAGSAVGAVIEIKDVRESVRAELHRELFLATLGHDLRGPLQTVTLGAHMLAENPHLCEREQAALRRTLSSAGRMERLIDHVLVFARTQIEGVPLTRRRADLAEICAQVVRDASARAGERSIESTGLTTLVGDWDPDRMTQVVDNLVGNGIHHGEGTVTVRIGRDGASALLSVHNGGTPIPEAARATLFEPFRRASEHRGGFGLGLYIVDQIVRAHGGTVTVASDATSGTTFAVRLPLSSPP